MPAIVENITFPHKMICCTLCSMYMSCKKGKRMVNQESRSKEYLGSLNLRFHIQPHNSHKDPGLYEGHS